MNVKAIRLYVLLLLTSKAHALPFLKGAKAFIITSNCTSDNANITYFDILPLDTLNSAVCLVTNLELEQDCRGRESNKEL